MIAPRRPALLVSLLVACAATPALAQADQCSVPAQVDVPTIPAPDAPAHAVPVTGYSLALTWSPEFCRTRQSDSRHAMQCGRGNGSAGGSLGRFGFVVHGLWPESDGATPPQWCSARPAPLTAQTVRRNLCMTPSPALLAHEWAKHGTCAWPDPDAYYASAQRLYGAVRIPDMAALSRRGDLNAGDLRRALAARSPGLFAQAIRVEANRAGWLQEVRICYSRVLRPVRCRDAGLPDRAPLKIWRGGS